LNKTEDIGNEPIVKELVADQMKQWSDMIERHHKEEWDLLKNQITQQGDLLKRLLMISQSAQIKLLESIFERENKEMKAKQAKISVETAKEVSNDKTLRNKAERERRLKEKNSNNTKKFIDERKNAAMRQDKEKKKLKKLHEKQIQDLERETDNAMDTYRNAELEYKLAAKMECFI